jgi:hypothetical protein
MSRIQPKGLTVQIFWAIDTNPFFVKRAIRWVLPPHFAVVTEPNRFSHFISIDFLEMD